MSLPTSLHAFTSELKAFDRAIDAERGIRIEFDSLAKARAYMARLHQARVLDRRENTKTLEETSPMHGKSDYDALSVSVREDTEGNHWLYIEKNEVIPGEVEEL